MNIRDAVEYLHLQFLRVLCAGPDRDLFTLKGGSNLRLFFGSARSSEDVDLDVAVVAKTTLKNRIDRILQGTPFVTTLQAKRIEIIDVSAPKQTDTTQRWKIGLRVPGAGAVRTKIEFSRRQSQAPPADVSADPISQALAQQHALARIVVSHYLAPAAIAQKIRALAGRPETQARDVFDLQILSMREHVPVLDAQTKGRIESAIERAMSLSRDEFESQVVAYLDADEREFYTRPDAWQQMQLGVIEWLEALRR